MPAPCPSAALVQYIDDELLRAPLIFDQLLDGVFEQVRLKRSGLGTQERADWDDMQEAVRQHWGPLSQRYLDSLQEQATAAVTPVAAKSAARSPRKAVLELVDDDSIALDIELSRTIQSIKDGAEHELRDLQAFLAGIVGDMDIAEDHNPLHPAVHARALRAAAQALPGPLRQQLAFIRGASEPFVRLLRDTYAAACARLEDMGVEPATHRTLLLPDGTRRLQVLPDVTYAPDLQRIRDAMPRTLRRSLSSERVKRLARGEGGAPGGAPVAATGFGGPATGFGPTGPASATVAAALAAEHRERGLADRQSVELVNRLFKAFALDERVPEDVGALIARLRGPAMRLTLRDASVLDRREHPLWRLIHLFAYQAEMAPARDDSERLRWLRYAERAFDELAGQALQTTVAYRRAVEQMEAFLQQRLAQRCTALAAQFAALQKTEAGLAALRPGGAAAQAAYEPALDTVPAALMPKTAPPAASPDAARSAAQAWFDGLQPGVWLRLLLKGAWVHAQLLWLGERRQILLLGNGASEATYAVRQGVLLRMHEHGLAKTLQMRSLVGAAAMRVQEQLAMADAA